MSRIDMFQILPTRAVVTAPRSFYGGGGGTGNQLTELIPLDRAFSQVGAFIKASKNSTIFIDNIRCARVPPSYVFDAWMLPAVCAQFK